jgi:FkbM family methyltransferase
LYEILRKSYSQNGEDLIIDKILKGKKTGFYIDVGANNPDRFSNTKRFYQKGWTGINIEPNYSNYSKFLKKRPRDINLNVGIGNYKGNLKFYTFFPNALSTFSIEEVKKYKKQGFKLIQEQKIEVKRLKEILKKYAPKEIDFISIDTEGFDFEVLKSNNWDMFRPKIICIESIRDFKYALNKGNKINIFLKNKDYKKVYENNLNSIWIDKREYNQ